MSLEEPESQSFAEILAEETGKDMNEFQPPEDLKIPDLEDLDEHDADEFYSDE